MSSTGAHDVVRWMAQPMDYEGAQRKRLACSGSRVEKRSTKKIKEDRQLIKPGIRIKRDSEWIYILPIEEHHRTDTQDQNRFTPFGRVLALLRCARARISPR